MIGTLFDHNLKWIQLNWTEILAYITSDNYLITTVPGSISLGYIMAVK